MNDLVRAATQFLSDPRLWRVVAGCVLISALCLAGLWWGVAEGVEWVADKWPRWTGWLHYGKHVAGGLVAVLLFPVFFVFAGSFFQETVADAVEARHYANLPPADGAPLASAVFAAVRFTMRAVAVNLLALPLYLVLMWVAGSGLFLMLAVNGMLTGREYFEVVALRRMPRLEMDALRRANRGTIFRTGCGIAALTLVPFVNLLAPVLGAAMMVHTVQRLRSGTRWPPQLPDSQGPGAPHHPQA